MPLKSKAENEHSGQIPADLRLGNLARIYYEEALGEKLPRQPDLLDAFFPGLLIEEIPSDGNEKRDAEFDDQSLIIRAVRYHGHFYIGANKRITQILGRLIGTAKGSQEKERSTAERLQRHLTDILVNSPDAMHMLRDKTTQKMAALSDDQMDHFLSSLSDYLDRLMDLRESQTHEESQAELFPIDDEVFEILMTNVAYQDRIGTIGSLGCLFTWLLLGGLLRNQVSRIATKYLSTFELRIPEDDDRITHEDLEEGESYYEGDDLDNRFPGVEWYCDRCGEHLNEQPGFDDHQPYWTCLRCGYKNRIAIDEIYNCEMEYQSGSAPVDKADFFRALKEQTDHLEKEKQAGKTWNSSEASADPLKPE